MNDQIFSQQFSEGIAAAYQALYSAQNILLVSHQKPDGDTSGSAIAMAEILELAGKKVTLFCKDPLPEEFQFLPKASEYVHEFRTSDYDMAMVFDAGSYKMIGIHEEKPEFFTGGIPLWNIDHHLSNEQYGTWNTVATDCASTTIVVAKILRMLRWKITPKVATPLLMGLYTDTGSLMHSNATADTHKEASHLLAAGADLRTIVQCIFRTKTVGKLKLWGRILSRATLGEDLVTTSFVRERDFRETGGNMDDLTGVVDYLNAVPGAKLSLLLTERGDKVKGSLRTLAEEIDVNEMAGVFGGGGHKKAAGFTVPGKLHLETRWRIASMKQGIPQNFNSVVMK
ncbi:MAG: DHH family phosphoesterase [Candidatus Peregrinibacteria bacterium]